MPRFPVALQPYTIRDQLQADFLGALSKVAEIGYTALEIGPPPAEISLEDMKAHLQRLNVQVMGCHASVEQLQTNPENIISFLHEMGGKYVTLSYRFESKEEVLARAADFNAIGRHLKDNGVQFLYHNHDWEFVKFDGEYALDLLLAHTDPDLVQMELDVYWVAKGGEDPATYLRKLQDRCPVLHMKDMEPGAEQFFAEVGEGILDMPGILQVAEEIGVKWLVVEQDLSRRNPFESIQISLENLKKMEAVLV
ncbi:sugar phosphate isomerase/epimerase family protein [Deinococcus cellulosilyticus]|uniref:Sugar phosphate isomerase n=1 Tax=Deinococcus cellulosilyticus (strain DSM 18568 / NBRC 106333 / KACC 11606 / 5516J-15) TaxID=1223518 RepID=A0A511N1Z8_DEIC1|nr:sugar phosphate isomerase/epimerase [Deinococcus cellulosilyticus]GEM46406.1 sugar phosphate isomerase [Deinococcus cellulosilyticus NBRC 106333 = KACC 11606]